MRKQRKPHVKVPTSFSFFPKQRIRTPNDKREVLISIQQQTVLGSCTRQSLNKNNTDWETFSGARKKTNHMKRFHIFFALASCRVQRTLINRSIYCNTEEV